MKTAAIITEYNPFHNGHAYQLSEVRERSGADYLIILMSGDFVQRGAPALFDKYLRTEAALRSGADLVLELPLAAATGSAQRFADGAVSILDGLGIVNELWFGSEEGSLSVFTELAEILSEEPAAYQLLLREELKKGLSYPVARSAALSCYLDRDMTEFLKQPNNILGLEYVLALKKRNSSIMPCTLQREGGGYHDSVQDERFSSATAVRNMLLSGDFTSVRSAVPENSFDLYKEAMEKGAYVTELQLSEALRYRLWMESADSLSHILDINQELANRIMNLRAEYRDFASFADLLQTRNQTGTAMKRALLHILLNITKEDAKDAKTILSSEQYTELNSRENCEQNNIHDSNVNCERRSEINSYSSYNQKLIRMLGLSLQAKKGGLLSGMSKDGPVILTANPGTHPLEEQYRKDLAASSYYEALKCSRSGEPIKQEYSRKLIVI